MSVWLSKQKPPKYMGKWNENDISNKFENGLLLQCYQVDQVAEASFFELVFDDEVESFMVDIPNLYSQVDKGKHNFITDSNKMHLFLPCQY